MAEINSFLMGIESVPFVHPKEILSLLPAIGIVLNLLLRHKYFPPAKYIVLLSTGSRVNGLMNKYFSPPTGSILA